MKYEDITFKMLGTRRQRPMYLSKFTQFRTQLTLESYPKDPHSYTNYFLDYVDTWIKSHQRVRYIGLETFARRDAILGTTQQLDELHMLHNKKIATYNGEYKYHRRLTDFSVKQIKTYNELVQDDVFVLSYPSCITTNQIDEFPQLLEYCLKHSIPVHIDGAWFGQCRNFSVDVSHPAIKSVSVSLSKALGMGSQRIGIRYTRERINGPIAIMNDFNYVNVSDMWLGVKMIENFGPDYWWKHYEDLYSKVCTDFALIESDSIHVGWATIDNKLTQFGVRTPLRMLIEGIFDERGTDAGLNQIEKEERL